MHLMQVDFMQYVSFICTSWDAPDWCYFFYEMHKKHTGSLTNSVWKMCLMQLNFMQNVSLNAPDAGSVFKCTS